jgi:uncharacterized protein
MEILQSYYIIIPLVILQSIAGVGILVVGTPLLLLLNYSIIQIMSFLLPISLLTSLFNIFFIKLVNKKKTKFQLDVDIKKIFFLYCLPGVFLGIMIIKYFQNYFNFELLVSVIIIISLLIKYKYKNLIYKLPPIFIKIILTFIGFIHGITNSGGTLLSLLLINNSNDNKDQLRYKITFYYFFLALFQYLIFSYTFSVLMNLNQVIYLLLLICTGSLIGNFLNKIINDLFFKRGIEFIAFLSSFFLIIKSFS